MELEVFSDIACPWCFIGKRRLFQSLGNLANPEDIAITWRAFQLQPGLPPEGVPAAAFFRQKFGSDAAVQAAFERVTHAGKADGIAFNFPAMKLAVSTRMAHRAVKVCVTFGAADAATEALFRAFFEEGANVGQLGEIIAAFDRHQVPVDTGEVQALLVTGAGDEAVSQDISRAAALGVGGVPLFLAASGKGLIAVEGAQSPEVLSEFIRRAHGGT